VAQRISGLTVRGRPIRVAHRGGHRFAVQIRGHELTVDQPRGSGGDDAGPTPTELFAASLAACVAHYGQTFLERHGVDGTVATEATWWVDLGAERVSRVQVRVEAPRLPPALEAGFREAVDRCMVHNSLRHAPEVAIETVAAAEAAG